MADVNIKIQGLDELKQKFKSFPGQLKNEGKNIVRSAALLAERESKIQAPVSFGTLSRSIKPKFLSGGSRAIVGPNVKYALPVHQGTLRFRGGADRGREKWNRIRREYERRKSASGRTYFKRVVPPIRPGGIRPDKFMDRGAEKARPIIQKKAQALVDKLIKSKF